MLAGGFGLKDIDVKIVMYKKYTFAARLNCIIRDSGAHVSIVYFVVLTLFVSLSWAGVRTPPILISILGFFLFTTVDFSDEGLGAFATFSDVL
jgi:hypothetical protein